ncbi:unnamed protein product [Calypogeia fissa]
MALCGKRGTEPPKAADVKHSELLAKSGNSQQLDGKKFHFITKFKLALAEANPSGQSYSLPPGFTVEGVIADYLQKLSEVIDAELENKYGGHFSQKEIQWCLTVPAMWEDAAKQRMKKCAERAGLVSGPSNKFGEGSPHPVIIVLEPEAASVYCLHYLKKIHDIYLAEKRKFLIVDAGGGTVDLVLHETVKSAANGSNQVKEICSGSSGGLCGSTFVDDAFYKLVSRKIVCYEKYMSENPRFRSNMRKSLEQHKVLFEGDSGCSIWLPASMSRYWENYCTEHGVRPPGNGFDTLEITLEEMKAVFDCSVDRILELIQQQLNQVASEEVDALLVVGGFSGSKYLMDRIHREFDGKVKRIINPAHPGKAVVTGAVAYGCLGKEIVTARISKKTYGVGAIDYDDRSKPHLFGAFVRRGDEVSVKHCVEKIYHDADWKRKRRSSCFNITVYSSKNRDPDRVTDPGVQKLYPVSITQQ